MIKLYRGDCLDIMPMLPDKSVDMILCDLPYEITQNKWDITIPFEKMWEQLNRIVKQNCAMVFTGSQPFTSLLISSNLKMFKTTWIWQKNRGSNFGSVKFQPMKEHEDIIVFSKGTVKYYPIKEERKGSGSDRVKYDINCKTRTQNYGNFNDYTLKADKLRYPSSIQKWNTEVGYHSNQKPIPLGEYFIKTYSLPNETILDISMGSGTFGVSAVNTNRNFIGIEKDCPKDGDKHFRMAIKRITEAGGRGIEVIE